MRTRAVLVMMLVVVLAVTVACSREQTPPAAQKPAGGSESDLAAIGTEAYIYGYPLVTIEMTRRVMTNVTKPEGTRAPMGQFVRMREYPTADFRDVTAPNADTLYTTTWLDLRKEPWVLSIPDMKDRYFLFPQLQRNAKIWGS